MYTVYILHSSTFNKIYIGYTSDLQERLLSHNELGTKGWTKSYRPWQLLYKEGFNAKAEALMREKALKSGKGRKWIHERLLQR